jgi:hypothetical protein
VSDHWIRLNTNSVEALERALLAWSRILQMTGNFRATDATRAEADLVAHTAAIVQEHKGASCRCNSKPIP